MTMPGQGGTTSNAGMPLRYGKKILHHTAFHYTLTTGTPNTITTLGAGTPAVVESAGITAGELAGIQMTTADEAYTLLGLGDLDIDLTRDIHARVVYALQEAAKSGMVWAAWLKGLKLTSEELLSDAKVSADGSITWAAEPANVGAGAFRATPWRAFNLGSPSAIVNDEYLMLAVELDALGTATADNVYFHALELRYTRDIAPENGVRDIT